MYLFVTERSQPKTFAENVGFGLERIFGAGLEQTQEVLDNSGGRVVAVKVDEAFAVDWRCINECRLLRVVDEVTGVNACWWLVLIRLIT